MKENIKILSVGALLLLVFLIFTFKVWSFDPFNVVFSIPLIVSYCLFFCYSFIKIFRNKKIDYVVIGLVAIMILIYWFGEYLFIPSLIKDFYYYALLSILVSALLRNYFGGFYNEESIDEKTLVE